MSDVNRQNEKFYSERDVIRQGQIYVNHVFHMTSEGLHSKSDIAAELAHRDLKIIELEQRIKELEQDAVELRRRALNGPKISAVLEMLSNGNGLLRQIVGTHYDGNGIVIRIASNTIDAAIGASHE